MELDEYVRDSLSSVRRAIDEDVWKSIPFGRRTPLHGLAAVYTAAVDFSSFDIEISIYVESPGSIRGVVGVFAYDAGGELTEIVTISPKRREQWAYSVGGVFEFTASSTFRGLVSGQVQRTMRTILVYCKALTQGNTSVQCVLHRRSGRDFKENDGLMARLPLPKPIPTDIVSAFQLLPSAIRSEVVESVAIGLYTARQDFLQLRRGVRNPQTDTGAMLDELKRAFLSFGLNATLRYVYTYISDSVITQKLLEMLAVDLSVTDRNASVILMWNAYLANPTVNSARKLAARLFKQGNISSASAMISLNGKQPLTRFLGEIVLAAELKQGVSIPSAAPPAEVIHKLPKGGEQLQIAYVAAGSLPVLSSGYSVRTHQILLALSETDMQATCFLRPGFPWDRPDLSERVAQMSRTGTFEAGSVPQDYQTRYDGVEYKYLTTTPLERAPGQYIHRSSEALEASMGIRNYGIIHAASNYRTALPALIAARRLGLPFIYEVRGLWELTAASKFEGWEETERFELDRSMEALVAREADHVIAITGAVADELANCGVDREVITIVPNAVDEQVFRVEPRDATLAAQLRLADAITLVYCGSLVSYEGLDDVIAAVGILRDEGTHVNFVIVGDGSYRSTLERLVVQHHLQDRIYFIGSVSASEVAAYWSLADIVPIMRKDYRVCRVVSPLKPFEAMAMGKAVIASDLHALREIICDGVTGRLCSPENPHQVAELVRELINDTAQRLRLGDAARNWIVTSRTWRHNGQILRGVYEETLNAYRRRASGSPPTLGARAFGRR